MDPIKISVFILNLAVFGVGCWEADRANSNVPTVDTSPGETQGYAFAIVCAVLNIAGSVLLTCSLCLDKKREPEGVKQNCSVQCGVFIWGCVLFAGIFNHTIRTGPFQDVVVVQFSMAMASIFLLCCLSVVGVSVQTTKEVNNPLRV